MKRTQLLVVLGLMGVTGLVTGCPGEDQEVRKYLGKDGGELGLYHWEQRIGKAICQLEVNNPGGLVSDDRICPGGGTDIKAAPSYPPPPNP